MFDLEFYNEWIILIISVILNVVTLVRLNKKIIHGDEFFVLNIAFLILCIILFFEITLCDIEMFYNNDVVFIIVLIEHILIVKQYRSFKNNEHIEFKVKNRNLSINIVTIILAIVTILTSLKLN